MTEVHLPKPFIGVGQNEVVWEHGERSVLLSVSGRGGMEVRQTHPWYTGHVSDPDQNDIIQALRWMMGEKEHPYRGTFWDGKPAYCKRVQVVVAQAEREQFWFSPYAGQIRWVVRVQHAGGMLYLDDDRHHDQSPGHGWFFVTWGRGLARNPFRIIEVEREATPEDIRLYNTYESVNARKLSELICEWERIRDDAAPGGTRHGINICIKDLRKFMEPNG